MFSLIKTNIKFKSFEDWHRVLFATKYLHINIQSILNITSTCASMLCWFIYVEHFLKEHGA